MSDEKHVSDEKCEHVWDGITICSTTDEWYEGCVKCKIAKKDFEEKQLRQRGLGADAICNHIDPCDCIPPPPDSAQGGPSEDEANEALVDFVNFIHKPPPSAAARECAKDALAELTARGLPHGPADYDTALEWLTTHIQRHFQPDPAATEGVFAGIDIEDLRLRMNKHYGIASKYADGTYPSERMGEFKQAVGDFQEVIDILKLAEAHEKAVK